MVTLDDKWQAARKRPSGFDFLRVGLSTAIVLWHTLIVCYGESAQHAFWTGPMRPLVYFIVPSFFALSGFLVAGSLLRNHLPSFFALRAIRIFPALAMEVILSALIIGPIFTELNLSDYFTRKEFFAYFLNIAGDIHYYLPGVFDVLPEPRINVQLWTIPYELECYIALGILALLRLHRKPKLFAILTFALATTYAFLMPSERVTLALETQPSGEVIVLSFLSGVALFLLKEKLPFSLPLFSVTVILAVLLVWIPEGTYLAAFPIAYITVALGLTNARCKPLHAMANYSYGIFLYGVPAQQVISALFPEHRYWWFNFALGYPLAIYLAACSWHGLESKILRKRAQILAAIAPRFKHPSVGLSITGKKRLALED